MSMITWETTKAPHEKWREAKLFANSPGPKWNGVTGNAPPSLDAHGGETHSQIGLPPIVFIRRISPDSVIGCQELRGSRRQGQLRHGTDADSMLDDRFYLESKDLPHL